MKTGRGEQRQRLGELLVEHGLINTNQLKEALKRQVQVGGQIGSILIELGFITTDELLDFLSRQLGVPSANLFKLDVPPKILRFLPLEKIKSMKVVPLAVDDNTVTLAMVNPRDMVTLSEIEFSLGKKVEPVVVPAMQMETAIKSLMAEPDKGLKGMVLEKEAQKAETQKAPELLALLRYLVESPATDMLLTAGVPPSLKIHNDIKRAAMAPLTPLDCERYARGMMSGEDWKRFILKGDRDFAVTYPEIGRFRISVYKQRNSISVAIRYIAEIIPTLEELNLPEWLKDYALKSQGLILVAGPTGHGKTTTLAAMIDIINTYRRCNIVTLEDPIEYLHKHKNSNVNQREIGLDTESFHEGLKRIFRQYPDVIVVGELRDKESFEIALQAADTGHLVLSTVHSNNSTSAIERIINMFPSHQQNLIRIKLADTLLLVFSQRLVSLKEGDGRILAYEKLINSYRIRNLIREEKIHQIRSQMQVGTEEFSSIDSALANLYKEGLITFEKGLLYAENEQFFREISGAV